MNYKLFTSFFLCICSFIATAQNYKKIHFNAIVVDTHNDIPTTAIDKLVLS